MEILVACESSGTVRDAFVALGHDAYSCDLLPDVNGSSRHIQEDALVLVKERWDMVIAHPPCTHLATSGARWFPEKIADGRQQQGIDFFMAMADANAPLVCIENPAGIMSTKYREPEQYIQPYQFGHDAAKRTGLWLTGLPKLRATQWVPGKPACCGAYLKPGEPCETCHGACAPCRRWANQTIKDGADSTPPRADRWSIRAKTYTGIALAMAAQWNRIRPPKVWLTGFFRDHNP